MTRKPMCVSELEYDSTHRFGEHGNMMEISLSPLLHRYGQEKPTPVLWKHWLLVLRTLDLRDSQRASISSWLLAYRYNTHCFKIAAQFGANRAHNSIQIKCYSVEIWIANIMEHLHFSLPVWWARDLKLPHVSEIQVKEHVLDPNMEYDTDDTNKTHF